MTQTTESSQEPHDALNQEREGRSVLRRVPLSWVGIAFWTAQFLTILPVWTTAYRDGHGGWFPTLDAATTVLRATDVFSSHFPLVGMWTSVSSKLGAATYFPGATELYIISVPVHFLGPAWGPLIGMAVLNSAWLIAGGWLLRRRLGTVGGTWALLALALLVWTMGSEALIDVAPMQMITIPFAIFLIATWSVADRDLDTIWFFALIVNFLLLNHLVLTFLVPVIGLCAPVALIVTLRNARRNEPDKWPGLRRKLIRQLLIGLAITVVLWLPSLIQQFTNNPGNLTNLWRASGTDLSHKVSVARAIGIVSAMLGSPPFWFRDTFSSPLVATPGNLALVFLVVGIVGVWSVLAIRALRRRERMVAAVLVVAAVAVVAAVVNILNAPTDFGFKRQYFRSLWGTSMFFWLAIVIALVREWQLRRPAREVNLRWFSALGVVAVLVVSLFAIPHKNPGPGTNGAGDESVALTNRFVNRAVVLLRHRGQVRVAASGNFSSFALSSALVLALDHYGVDVCVPADLVAQYGKQRACNKGGPDVDVQVSSAAFPPYPGETTLVQATLLTPKEQREKSRLAAKVAAWLNTQSELHSSPRVRKILVDAYGTRGADLVEARAFDTNGFGLPSLMFSPDFVDFVATRSIWRPDGTVSASVDTGSLPPEDLVRWADLTQREYLGESVRVSVVDRPSSARQKATRSADASGN